MGPAEVWWRSRERARTAVERIGCAARADRWERKRLRSRLGRTSPQLVDAHNALARRDWPSAGESLRLHFCARHATFPIAPGRRQVITESIHEQFPNAAGQARSLAERLLNGRRRLLGYDDLSIGSLDQIDWHRDPVHKRGTPGRFWAGIHYLDPQFGDHKIIWELNRHQHWLSLGRAAWLTGDRRYAEAFHRELSSWLAANPPLIGINWASMLELGFRALSWIWSLHFFVALETESDDTSWLIDVLIGLDAQLNHIARHLSTYFSPNTHLLGEGLALYTAGRVLPELKSARRWETIGRQILRNEADRQVCRDGGHAERSAHYHRYALDFYLLALTIGRLTDDPDVDLFAEVTARMAVFCRALASDDGHLPTIGDDDGGSLFPICDRRPADAADSLSLAAALLNRPELAVGHPPEETLWMLGGDRSQLRWPTSSQSPESRLFADTGYAVLRSRTCHAILDVGPLGFLNGGHAHADALSLVMSIEGRPLLVDPGTSTYTMDAERRDLYRSTFMHNTLTVDGRPQSTPASPFHWRSAVNSSLRFWRTGRGFDAVEGEHDGYLPHRHRRAVLRDPSGLWLVADHFLGRGDHRLDVRWHFDSAWRLIQSDSHAAAVSHVDGGNAGIASTGSKLTHGVGGAFGWRAPVYGQHEPGLTIEVTESGSAPLSMVTVLAAGSSAKGLSVEPIHIITDRPDGRQRIAVQGHYGAGTFIAIFATEIAGAAELDARTSQHVDAGGNRFHTDARIAVLCLSPDFEPTSLTLIDGTLAAWTGPQSFHLDPLTSAADLHLDRSTLARLGHGRTTSVVSG
jgi:Heparinase II/III-like protein/Heparinase II/III N-terminus